ncbi:hypothetical protein T484DRAFT_1934841 [Baffinella frigidus]|nr:hypothetical protein T484DRAFT_1934841 [Cryptophyta sp. CCMP2293]
MGRGAGGRAGTRRTDSTGGGQSLDHGSPLLSVLNESSVITNLVHDAIKRGHLSPFTGTQGRFDTATGASTVADGESFVGAPMMSSFARGLLAGAADVRFGTRVQRFVAQDLGGWRLVDAAKRDQGLFDWLVVAGATPALARWEAGFKEPPPLSAAAFEEGGALPELGEVVRALDEGLDYDACHVAMLSFEEDASKALLAHLPFDVTRVSGDDRIAAVIRRGTTLAIHSTAAFAARHKNTMGATQHTSRVNSVVGSIDAEAHVCTLLVDAVDQLFPARLISSEITNAHGPHLQRWGWRNESAIRNELREDKCLIRPNERFAFAGDFTGDEPTLSAALASGVSAANALVDAIETKTRSR